MFPRTGFGKERTLHLPPYKRDQVQGLLLPQVGGMADTLTEYSFAWSGINQKQAIKKKKKKKKERRKGDGKGERNKAK